MKTIKDFFVMIVILKNLLLVTYGEWKNEVWGKGLDSRYCCDGRECGCDGMTVREMYDPKHYQMRD